MPAGVELVRVRKGRGRIHLAAAVEAGRPVRTLCGKELAGARATDVDADCTLCIRRQHDTALVSSALFNDDRGEELLQASLEAARRRREGAPDLRVVPADTRRADAPKRRRDPAPAAVATPDESKRRGELDASGLRPFAEDVYVSPGGGIVRMDGDRVAEVTAGAAHIVRRRDGLRVTLGDLRISISGDALDVSLDRRQ